MELFDDDEGDAGEDDDSLRDSGFFVLFDSLIIKRCAGFYSII
jgi:hypothetical protein